MMLHLVQNYLHLDIFTLKVIMSSEILLCEKPVRFSNRVDRILFGRALAHTFLTHLQDGIVVDEIHGVWIHPEVKPVKTFAESIAENMIAAASVVGCSNIVGACIPTSFKPKLHVIHGASFHQFLKSSVVDTVVASEGSILREIWQSMAKTADDLNSYGLVFDRYGNKGKGWNCQTVAYEVIRRQGFTPPAKEQFNYAVPGWHQAPVTKLEAKPLTLKPI